MKRCEGSFWIARPGRPGIRSPGIPASISALFLLLFSTTATAQHQHALPDYQVIFDDFAYDTLGYPDTTDAKALFQPNAWLDRNGNPAYFGYAWYYYNWRWQSQEWTIHPSARFALNTEPPYSITMSASEGYTRQFLIQNEVPIQIQSGFTHEQGTWAVSVKLDDLENISYFTQAFWLISPMVESRSGTPNWSELNFEWQNWFAVLSQPGSRAWNTDLLDDAWAPSNPWVKRSRVSGPVFPEGQIPSLLQRTYMANGLQMHDLHNTSFETGETAGGIPLRNARLSDADHFTCYSSVAGHITDISNPTTCMGFLLRGLDDTPHPWVHLMIQYDSRVVRYALYVPAGEEDHVYMESRITVNRRSLPLIVTLGMHTPNNVIVLGSEETPTLEVDWFYYSPATDLAPRDVLGDIQAFRERGWSQVNLDAEPLQAPEPTPWAIRGVRPPTADDPGWIVDTTLRGSNIVEVQWNYRTRTAPDQFFSDWVGWKNGGFRFELDMPVYEAEVDVRAKDHDATAYGELRRWTDTPCTRYNYVTGLAALCEGGVVENSRYSLDQVPLSHVLDTNYPNPFAATTSIRFGLPYPSNVTLTIYDTLGRRIALLLDQSLSGGFYTVTWDAANVPNGTYFYRLETNDFTGARSMVLIR